MNIVFVLNASPPEECIEKLKSSGWRITIFVTLVELAVGKKAKNTI
jgi:hypothetical protein